MSKYGIRAGILAGIALLPACASAGKDTPEMPPVDAPPSIDAPPPIDAMVDLCPGPATCSTAPMLGMVSGDTGSQMLMTSGYQSTWIRLRVTEDSTATIQLSLTATLTSPPGLDFDLFMYLNESMDVVDCSTKVGTTTTTGNANAVRALWGESTIGANDGRYVSLEIRRIAGVCAPDKPWQLTIVGNT